MKRYNLPLNDNYQIINSFYTGGIENGCPCDNCNKLIANVAVIKNNNGQVFNVGLDCASTLSKIQGLYDVEVEFKELKSILAKINKFKKSGFKINFLISRNGNLYCYGSGTSNVFIFSKDLDYSQKYLNLFLSKVVNPEKIGFTYNIIPVPKMERIIASQNKDFNKVIIVDGYNCLITVKPYHNLITNEISGHDFYLDISRGENNIYSKRLTMLSNLENDINIAIRDDKFKSYTKKY
jgi:hypothetical protein